MFLAAQSTALSITVGPVLDSTGAFVNSDVVGSWKISKNGATPAALNGSASLTFISNGKYTLALTATDLGTLGNAELVYDNSTNAANSRELQVVPLTVYNALVTLATTVAGGLGDVQRVAGTVQSAADIGFLAKMLAPVDTGTAQGGSGNTITLRAGASAVDNAYAGCLIACISGTGAGQRPAMCTAYTGSSKIATVSPGWGQAATDNTTVYAVIPLGAALLAIWQSTSGAFSLGTIPTNTTMINGTTAGVSNMKAFFDGTGYVGGTIKLGVDLVSILGTGLTQTVTGYLAAAFKKFFDVAVPTSTMNQITLTDTTTDLTNKGLGNLDVAVSTRLASASYTAPDNADIVAIKAKTDNLPAAPASTTNITAAAGVTLTSAYDPAKTAAQAGDAMALTSGERTTLVAAVWAAGTRSLTTFGTLVSDVASAAATAVWAVGTRTLTAFGFTVNTNANSTETAIKTVTDQFVFTIPNQVDANAVSGGSGYTPNQIADEVETRTIAAVTAVVDPVALTSDYDAAKTAATQASVTDLSDYIHTFDALEVNPGEHQWAVVSDQQQPLATAAALQDVSALTSGVQSTIDASVVPPLNSLNTPVGRLESFAYVRDPNGGANDHLRWGFSKNGATIDCSNFPGGCYITIYDYTGTSIYESEDPGETVDGSGLTWFVNLSRTLFTPGLPYLLKAVAYGQSIPFTDTWQFYRDSEEP
jgi:hypothetical protein